MASVVMAAAPHEIVVRLSVDTTDFVAMLQRVAEALDVTPDDTDGGTS